MKKSKSLKTALKVTGGKLLSIQTPVVVGWQLTKRCNLNCLYCDSRNHAGAELSTKRILKLIRQMKRAGIIYISYTGGEPLLRHDIGEILKETKEKELHCSLATNGSLVPGNIEEIKFADHIILSYDGPEHIHDRIRGKGTHAKVLEAIDLIRKKMGDIVELNCVFTSLNLEGIEKTIAFSREEKIPIGFSVVQHFPFSSGEVKNIMPSREELQDAIDMIIDSKMSGNKYITSSTTALKHLRNWPDDTAINCAGGKIFCRIDSTGEILSCGNYTFSRGSANCRDNSFSKAFASLEPVGCSQCWCDNKVDMNLIYSLNFHAIMNRIRSL